MKFSENFEETKTETKAIKENLDKQLKIVQKKKEELDQKNSASMTLLQRMQQKPGVIVRNGVPLIQKALTKIGSFAPIQVIDKGLEPFKPQFYREITEDDIVRLTEIRIKRISKFNSFKADVATKGIEECFFT